MKTGNHILTILTLFSPILTVSSLTLVYSSQLKLEEGATLTYRYAIIGTGSPASETGNATFQILTFNQTTLFFRINTTETFDIKINYQNGFPTYADRLYALIYLPPECITQSLQGNLEWTTQIETQTLAAVSNMTSQTLNFTVEAGTFQSINITLNFVGWEYGNLTLIYDLNSGILIYEQWIPEYGDIIVHALTSIAYPAKPWQSLLNLTLPTTTFAIPTAIAFHQTQKTFKKGKRKHTQQPAKPKIKSGLPTKIFYTLTIGALLSLTSTVSPWSQLAELQIYLPSSLPSLLTQSTEFLTSTLTFTAISITAHAAAILAWLSIVAHIYTGKKLTAQLTTVASTILALTSAILFFQTGLTPSWGLPLTISGAILAITSTALTNIKQRKKTLSSTAHITSPKNK